MLRLDVEVRGAEIPFFDKKDRILKISTFF
jgi:hypothetical protein